MNTPDVDVKVDVAAAWPSVCVSALGLQGATRRRPAAAAARVLLPEAEKKWKRGSRKFPFKERPWMCNTKQVFRRSLVPSTHVLVFLRTDWNIIQTLLHTHGVTAAGSRLREARAAFPFPSDKPALWHMYMRSLGGVKALFSKSRARRKNVSMRFGISLLRLRLARYKILCYK